MTKQEREKATKVRAVVIKEIAALERKYGESAVSGAFDRHRRIRRAHRKLRRARAEINAQIAKLRK